MRFRISQRMQDIRRTMIRQIFDAAPPDAINLGLGQPDLPTPDFAIEDAIRGIHAGKTGYTTTAGVASLRESIAARYPGQAEGSDGVVVTIGSQEAMFAVCMTLLDPGDELLIPEPGYPAYPILAHLAGATAVTYPLRSANRFRIDPADIADRLTSRTRAVIVNEPSNPTGACTGHEELAAIAALLRTRGIPWISDEIYSAFDYDRSFRSLSVIAPGEGLVIGSLSKDLSMTGWRLGWLAGPAVVAKKIAALHQYLVTCSSSISQAAAARAFGTEGDEIRKRYLEIFRDRRGRMARALGTIPRIEFQAPDGAFYFFVDVTAYGDSIVLARSILEQANVIVIPGEAFGEGGRGFLRISFAAPTERIEEAIDRIRELLT